LGGKARGGEDAEQEDECDPEWNDSGAERVREALLTHEGWSNVLCEEDLVAGLVTNPVLLYWKRWVLHAEDPGRVHPGSSDGLFHVGLGDSLEAAVLEANRVGRIDWNTGTDDLSDEVCTVARNPDVTGLVNCGGASCSQVGRGLLEAGGG